MFEALATASAVDHNAPICGPPRDRPRDLRLAGERPEAVPDGRFECVAEPVTNRPSLDGDELVAISSAQDDPVDAAASAGAAAPARRTGHSRARAVRAAAVPDACARPRVRRACDTALPEWPCTSRIAASSIRGRCVAPSVAWSFANTPLGTARPGLPRRSGTITPAKVRGRSRCRLCWRADVAPLSKHRGDPEVRNRALPPVSANPR